MLQMLGAVAPLAKILFSTIEKSVPDKDLQEKLKAQLQTQLMQSHTQELTAAAKIIEAEAKAGWFASSWRPLLMYVLIFILIWNYVLGPVILFFFKASITITLQGGQVIFRGNEVTVVKITDKNQLGKDAACFYGGYYLEPSKGETRWCTSGPGLTYFERYIKDGPLYVIIKNDDTKLGQKSQLPATRYQFHFPSNQFMDAADHSIDLVQFLNGPMAELKELFKPEFAKGLTVGGEKLVIDSFSHGAIGKFIALYGLDDLIGNLPDTLTEFQIQNRDSKNNDVIINIPEEIGRFKNLHMILLDNCIDSIPEAVCQLPKLRFMALINNPKLTSIPECIADLPNLYFLNLKGSPNVKVPQAILDKAEDLGNGMLDLQSH